MSESDIQRLTGSLLFQKLLENEQMVGGDHELSEQVRDAVRLVSPILAHVHDNLPEFTLHDAEHSARVGELIPQFLPSQTLSALNSIEITILLLSTYLHDIGMACSRDERERVMKTSAEFQALLATKGPLPSDPKLAHFEEDRFFGEFLRSQHARRSAGFIEELIARGQVSFSWKGAPFARLVKAVCESHELPVSEISDLIRFPRDTLVRNLRINVQYLALVLRLADILDFDPCRAPQVLLDFINPRNDKSLEHWQKHRSIIGWDISPEHIRLEAECTQPACHRALHEYVDAIEAERRDSLLLTGSYRDRIGETYRFDLTEPVVKIGIRSNGTYIYSDLRFSIDFQRVLDLLMGERLYGRPELSLRELLQNAVDAVRMRAKLESRDGNPYSPIVRVVLNDDQLVVEDNGIGMDQHVFQEYFVQVGRSYYQSPEFRSKQLVLDATSEFGIGILSVFMVASSFKVESRLRPDDPLKPPQPIKYEVQHAFAYFVQKPSSRRDIGTCITLRLKPGQPFTSLNLSKLVEEMAVFVEFPIEVETPTAVTKVRPKTTIDPPKLFECRFEVPLDATVEKGVSGISGRVSVGGVPSEEVAGVVAQNGFTIRRFKDFPERSETIGKLFSKWTSMFVSLDFRGPARLTLRPDRSDIVWDRHAESVRASIEKLTLRSFREHLDAKRRTISQEAYAEYVDALLEENSLTAHMYIGFSVPAAVRDIFLDFVPLPVLSGNGEVTRMFGRQVIGAERVAIVGGADLPESNTIAQALRDIQRALGSSTPVLIQGGRGHYSRSNLVAHVFGEATEYIITSVPGVVADVITNQDSVPREPVSLNGKMKLTLRLCSAGHGSPLLFHDASPSYFQSPTYNASHPSISPLFHGIEPRDNGCKELLLSFDDEVDKILFEVATSFPPHLWTRSKWGVSRMHREHSTNSLLIEVLKVRPQVLVQFNEAIGKLWRRAAEAGKIARDSKPPSLGPNDFPWFWSTSTLARDSEAGPQECVTER